MVTLQIFLGLAGQDPQNPSLYTDAELSFFYYYPSLHSPSLHSPSLHSGAELSFLFLLALIGGENFTQVQATPAHTTPASSGESWSHSNGGK